MKIVPLNTESKDSRAYLWKYLTLQKFLWFVTTKSLYYTRLDQLDDAYEGINQNHLYTLLHHDRNKEDGFIDVNHPNYEKFMFGKSLDKIQKEVAHRQKRSYVSCWIGGVRESAAMWNLYSEPGGVALRVRRDQLISTVCDQRNTFESDSILELYYGDVDYKDFTSMEEVSSQSFKVKQPAFRKDVSFEHEKEFRICLKVDDSLDESKVGLRQSCAIEALSVSVILHPGSMEWHYQNITSLVKAFGSELMSVKSSELKFR